MEDLLKRAGYLDHDRFVFTDPPTWQMVVPDIVATPSWLEILLQRPAGRDPQKHPIDYLASLGLLIRVWHVSGRVPCWGEMNQSIDRYVTFWYSTQSDVAKALVLEAAEGRLSDLFGHLDDALIGPFETDDHGKELRRLIQLRDELESLQLIVKSGVLRDGLDRFDAIFVQHIERWALVRITPFTAEPMCKLFQVLHMMWQESSWIRCYVMNSAHTFSN